MIQCIKNCQKKFSGQIIHTDIKPENVLVCVDESYIRKLASEATELHSLGLKLPASLVSTAPKEFQETIPTAKMSKNKKRRLKKKAKRHNELLKKQMEQIEEMEEQKKTDDDHPDEANATTASAVEGKENGDADGTGTADQNVNSVNSSLEENSPESKKKSPESSSDSSSNMHVNGIDSDESHAKNEQEKNFKNLETGITLCDVESNATDDSKITESENNSESAEGKTITKNFQ